MVPRLAVAAVVHTYHAAAGVRTSAADADTGPQDGCD